MELTDRGADYSVLTMKSNPSCSVALPTSIGVAASTSSVPRKYVTLCDLPSDFGTDALNKYVPADTPENANVPSARAVVPNCASCGEFGTRRLSRATRSW